MQDKPGHKTTEGIGSAAYVIASVYAVSDGMVAPEVALHYSAIIGGVYIVGRTAIKCVRIFCEARK